MYFHSKVNSLGNDRWALSATLALFSFRFIVGFFEAIQGLFCQSEWNYNWYNIAQTTDCTTHLWLFCLTGKNTQYNHDSITFGLHFWGDLLSLLFIVPFWTALYILSYINWHISLLSLFLISGISFSFSLLSDAKKWSSEIAAFFSTGPTCLSLELVSKVNFPNGGWWDKDPCSSMFPYVCEHGKTFQFHKSHCFDYLLVLM